MKYYHIIYNSSQNTQSGSAGFGVRTYTEGTPQEYIDILEANDYFAYSSGNMQQPSPNALLEDGSIVLRYPVTYNFAKYPVSSLGKEIYVVARTVNVGFDYPYYVKFAAARLGNFVVDAYIFEEMPPVEVFEMLYEQPAKGSAAFVPRNPKPSPDNEEMKALSLNTMELLPPEEKPFSRQEKQPVSNLSFELLFAFIEAVRTNMPLLVRCEQEQAATLMADLMHLLPHDMREKATFFINYQTEGLKDGFKVFFINKTNPCDYEMTGQFQIFDAESSPKANTIESTSWLEDLAKLYADGNNKELEKQIHWLLNPEYQAIRNKSPKTKKVLYNYICNPETFSFRDVEFNEELLTTLKDYFAKDKANQALFDKILSSYLEHKDIKDKKLLGFVNFCNTLTGMGFNIQEVIDKERAAVTTKLVESSKTFKDAMDGVGLDKLNKFLDKGILEQHAQLISDKNDKELWSKWDKLYKYFYTEDEAKDPVNIISKMFSLMLPNDVINNVVNEFGVDNLRLCGYYTEVARRDSSLVDQAWNRTWDVLRQQIKDKKTLPDPKLAAGIDQFLVAPLMQDEDRQQGVVECKLLMDLLQGNFAEQDFNKLYDLASMINTPQSYKILYDRGMHLINEKQVKPFVKAVLTNLKPNAREFVARAETSRLKIELLTEFFKTYDPKECKKNIDKMRKDDILHLTDEEYNRLLRALGLVKDKEKDKGKKEGSNDSKGEQDNKSEKKKRTAFWAIVAGIVALLIALVVILVLSAKNPFKKSSSESTPTIETPAPTKNENDTTKIKATESKDETNKKVGEENTDKKKTDEEITEKKKTGEENTNKDNNEKKDKVEESNK